MDAQPMLMPSPLPTEQIVEHLCALDDSTFCDCLIAHIIACEGQVFTSGIQFLYAPWCLHRLQAIKHRNVALYYGGFLPMLRSSLPAGMVHLPELERVIAAIDLDVSVRWGNDVLSHGDVSPQELTAAADEIYIHGISRGVSSGWRTLDRHYTVRPDQFTVVVGQASAMKSSLVNALAMNLALEHNWQFGIFSPEHYPLGSLIASLVEMYTGMRFEDDQGKMPRSVYDKALPWIVEHFHVIEARNEEPPTIEWLLAMARYQHSTYGIQGLILDPWNEIDHPGDRNSGERETQYISRALSQVRRFSRANQVHTWMVVHPTKLQKAVKGPYAGKYPPPTLYDAMGCYSADTQVLTQRGWLSHDEIMSDDLICCFDAKTDTLHYEIPMQMSRAFYEGEMLHIVSDSLDALVTPGHTVLVKSSSTERRIAIGSGRGRPLRWKVGEWDFMQAQDLFSEEEVLVPLATPVDDGEASPVAYFGTARLRPSRHITHEPYSGDVFCLTVSTGAYVTRRNGHPGIYGNSSHWRNKADNGLSIWRDDEADSPVVEVHIQKVRTRAVGRPGMIKLVRQRCGRFGMVKEDTQETNPWSY